jgi:hypothetical protein
MTAAAAARVVVTMTEAKTAALQRLAVLSRILGRPGDRNRHGSVPARRPHCEATGR